MEKKKKKNVNRIYMCLSTGSSIYQTDKDFPSDCSRENELQEKKNWHRKTYCEHSSHERKQTGRNYRSFLKVPNEHTKGTLSIQNILIKTPTR